MKKKIACVIWAREVKLNQFLAQALGADIIVSHIRYWRGHRLPVVVRYLFQAGHTLRELYRIRPRVILVMNPPITAPLTVYLYCLLFRAQFIIDTHTAAFLDRKWRVFFFLHHFLARRALLNTVHNYKNLEILREWGIENGYVLQFFNPSREDIMPNESVELPAGLKERIIKHNGLKVFMVNRFASDDAWREVTETAQLMKDALFFITGDYSKIESLGPFPHNVFFTGYLEHDLFMKLMDRCDVVLALTKRRDTVLWSIREIMALNKPLVITDSEVLRYYFNEVALYTDMAPSDLKEKISLAWSGRFEIKGKIERYLQKDLKRWENDIAYLNTLINQ
jgi:hypothetical protein